MPKITAGTVREHREQMDARLVDVAERLLRTGGVDALTAGAVTAEAGIARNSLYRYVGSIDDLRTRVLMRYLPAWMDQVVAAVSGEDDPKQAVLTYVRVNLEQAAATGHGWLIAMARGLGSDARADVAGSHDDLARLLGTQVMALDPEAPRLTVGILQGIVEAGFARLDAGDPADLVVPRSVAATAAVLDSLV